MSDDINKRRKRAAKILKQTRKNTVVESKDGGVTWQVRSRKDRTIDAVLAYAEERVEEERKKLNLNMLVSDDGSMVAVNPGPSGAKY